MRRFRGDGVGMSRLAGEVGAFVRGEGGEAKG